MEINNNALALTIRQMKETITVATKIKICNQSLCSCISEPLYSVHTSLQCVQNNWNWYNFCIFFFCILLNRLLVDHQHFSLEMKMELILSAEQITAAFDNGQLLDNLHKMIFNPIFAMLIQCIHSISIISPIRNTKQNKAKQQNTNELINLR